MRRGPADRERSPMWVSTPTPNPVASLEWRRRSSEGFPVDQGQQQTSPAQKCQCYNAPDDCKEQEEDPVQNSRQLSPLGGMQGAVVAAHKTRLFLRCLCVRVPVINGSHLFPGTAIGSRVFWHDILTFDTQHGTTALQHHLGQQRRRCWESSIETVTQWAHNAITTSLLCQNDVATSFRRNNDVIIASCVRWARAIGPWGVVPLGYSRQTIGVFTKKNELCYSFLWRHIWGESHLTESSKYQFLCIVWVYFYFLYICKKVNIFNMQFHSLCVLTTLRNFGTGFFVELRL